MTDGQIGTTEMMVATTLMRYFTRFTDEIFAALIAVIFIVGRCETTWASASQPR